jgi:Mrp family chromosome partitioning ATPase
MPDVNLITLTDPRAPAAEAYRTLRTNLMFSSLDKPLRTLVITSAVPGEGKSTALANLAVTLAQSGHDTIIVDCDLRKPSQHDLWKLENTQGLTTMLLDEAALANPALQTVGVEHLRVLTSGPLPPNPADVLVSRRMDQAIDALKERAEYVLFEGGRAAAGAAVGHVPPRPRRPRERRTRAREGAPGGHGINQRPARHRGRELLRALEKLEEPENR